MKYYGDVPADHLELAKELETLEIWFLEHGERIPLLSAAKGYVCMACDYYSIYFDEEGDRLLKAADKICPGYFKAPILAQMAKDALFTHLIEQIKASEVGMETMVSLGFDGQ